MDIFATDEVLDEDNFGKVLAEFKTLSLLEILERRPGVESSGTHFGTYSLVQDWLKLNPNKCGNYAVESVDLLRTFQTVWTPSICDCGQIEPSPLTWMQSEKTITNTKPKRWKIGG